jgi:hypothetical protein
MDMIKEWENAYKWQYQAYPFFTSVYVPASITKFKGKYSVYWGDFLNYFQDGNLIAYKQSKTILKEGKHIIKETIAGDFNYLYDLKTLHQELKKAIVECEKAKNLTETNFEKIWSKIWPALSHTANILFSFDYPFDDYLNYIRVKDPKNFEYISKNIKNNGRSFMSEAPAYLLELDKRYKDFEIIFQKFNEKFFWLQNSYIGPVKIGREWLKKYLRELKTTPNTKSNKVAKIIKKNKYNSLIKLASYASLVRDDKKKLLLLAVSIMDEWLRLICKTYKLNYKLLRWLTVDEIKELVFNGKTIYLDDAKKYEKNKSRLGLMLSPGYKKENKSTWDRVLTINGSKNNRILKGVPASPGIYQGKVKVVLNAKEGSKSFKKGEILVASMTRPEYLSLMSRAGAFVTEEGGISCHAAIVARERFSFDTQKTALSGFYKSIM